MLAVGDGVEGEGAGAKVSEMQRAVNCRRMHDAVGGPVADGLGRCRLRWLCVETSEMESEARVGDEDSRRRRA